VSAAKPTVIVVDDDDNFREALVAHLEADPRVEVVGSAANGAEALALVVELQPDIVSMDLQMPVMNGIEATKAICKSYPDTLVVVVSGPSFTGNRNAVLSVGASVVLAKDRAFEEFVDTALDLVAR
jgi:NarL family two-component system response regulator LiaR